MATSNIIFQELCEICKQSGFHRRGHTFFRVQGDGVLLVLQYERKLRPFYSERLWFGFFSMYDELLPQWFTSQGAIPRYDTRYLTKSRAEREPSPLPTVIDLTAGDSLEDWIEFHLDLSEFRDMILPYLSSIQTQLQLCEAICFADIQESGSICWNYFPKAAPYAAAGDWDSAAKVIRAILRQHDVIWDADEELIARRDQLRDEDQKLVDRLALFVSRDADRIHAYLQNNYETNRKYAKFCMPKK